MELVSVRLVNIRSFADVKIDLSPGVVRIAGENGAGKSTIVAGISFAFLGPESVESRRYVLSAPASAEPAAGAAHGAAGEGGASPVKHVELDASSKLLRRGEAWGLAAVTFRTPRAPDRVFRVHRVIGKRPKPRAKAGEAPRDPLDVEEAALVALDLQGRVVETLETQKRLVAAATAKLLDLPEDAFVHAFKRIVAAPQGKLLQAIFEDNKERRDIYWKILGVDRYAQAAADATRMGRLLEERHLRRVDHAVVAAEQEVKGLEDAPELVKELEATLGTHEALAADKRTATAAAAVARERAADTVAGARERVASIKRLLDERAKVLGDAASAQRALADAEDAGRRVVALAPEVARFEALRAEQPAREKALAAFEASRGALAQARLRDEELRARDAVDARKLAKQLADAVASETVLGREADDLAKKHALAEREATALAPEARAALERKDAFAQWLARFKQPLERLQAALVRPTAHDLLRQLDDLVATSPRPESAADVALVARAAEVADEVSRRTGAVGEAKARLEGFEDLATKVGSGAICPFLTVSCPHPKGANLLETVTESATRERTALVAARKALDAAQAEQTLVRAAQQRLEKQRTDRQAWLARVAKTAPTCVAWLEAWDTERLELGRIAAETVSGPIGGTASGSVAAALAAADLVATLVIRPAPGASRGRGGAGPGARSTIGQGRLFEGSGSSAAVPAFAGPVAFVAPAEWDAPSLEDLAKVLRGRRAELETALPRGLERRLDDLAARLAHEAADLDARSQAASVRREKLVALLETAPKRLAEASALVAQLRAEEAALGERHRADAAARAADVAARVLAHAALEHVPAEHERYVAALEAARRADAEANRLRGLAEQAPAARERVERVAARVAELRAASLDSLRSLGMSGDATAGTSGDATDPLAAGALEQLSAAASVALVGAEAALEAARRAEQATANALLEAERTLGVVRAKLEDARRRAALLGERRARVEKLREARDHVAHACSVLRGGAGGGRLSGALYKALSELPVRLAERRVREVSSHARRIYRAIAPHETWDLLWDPKTYVLALGAPGMTPGQAVREGIAIDDMSGGQQMSAALALHLALVHTYARNCDVLFLDEPTTHLDAKRRRALAETLRSLRSRIVPHGAGEAGASERGGLVPLRQMFLISHDDAFEGLQDQVIRVLAGDGEHPSTIEGAPEVARAYADAVPLAQRSADPATGHAPTPEIESPAVATKRPRRPRKKDAAAG